MKRFFVLLLAMCGSDTNSNPDGSLPDGAVPDAIAPTDSDLPDSAPVDTCTGGTAYTKAWLIDPKMCLYVYATGLGRARQMAFAPNGDLFLSGAGSIIILYDTNTNGTSESGERATFATQTGLNHGIAFSPDQKYVYASSDTTVWRWAYASGDRKASGAAEIVVKNIPGGGHDTRTIVFDAAGMMYLNIGSGGNLDESTTLWANRGMVRRWNVATVPSGGYDYGGEVYASGLRNEVGLHIDYKGRFWAVENGRDNLTDPQFGNITNDNPAEEINRFDVPGKFYGYPFCWTEGNVPAGMGAKTQWADETLQVANRKTDDWCRDDNNVIKPFAAMQGHWAPLGTYLYTGSSLPWRGDLFVTSHGSWNRTPATGRVIARAHVNPDGTIATVEPILGELVGGSLKQGTWEARPVDVRQGPDDALYFSDDLGGRVFRIGYKP